MDSKTLEILERSIIDLEIENDELRDEVRQLANNLQLARAQIAAMRADRAYPVLEAVG